MTGKEVLQKLQSTVTDMSTSLDNVIKDVERIKLNANNENMISANELTPVLDKLTAAATALKTLDDSMPEAIDPPGSPDPIAHRNPGEQTPSVGSRR